ncbi:hypothetical protein OG625_03190 [Streptomyces sp. NBC_01351]|uniref:hypothetical protein n=1 Tax=Streptomyces sp. NBC_01351 TaxID=2903833 RepID=UPI002E3176F0|nr:hypothetical protein [Streptomyces sp. NBC_01351]
MDTSGHTPRVVEKVILQAGEVPLEHHLVRGAAHASCPVVIVRTDAGAPPS